MDKKKDKWDETERRKIEKLKGKRIANGNIRQDKIEIMRMV